MHSLCLGDLTHLAVMSLSIPNSASVRKHLNISTTDW